MVFYSLLFSAALCAKLLAPRDFPGNGLNRKFTASISFCLKESMIHVSDKRPKCYTDTGPC